MVFHLTAKSTHYLQEDLASHSGLAQTTHAEGIPTFGHTDHNLFCPAEGIRAGLPK